MVLRYLMTRTWLSVLSVSVAVVVAIPTYVFLGHRVICSGPTVLRGADIDTACTLVGYSGFLTLASFPTHRWQSD